ncbi:hypothetical protein EYF80_047162 [Liparis tanakae]|uniref:Uncharacterized protein n=1 Tax=Liparis tanakae TaxID=230148 RepID=A0A4Z2FP41_9TELE|nr:hypothetical protein EYF80_047162 [Liparis tanakae]
MANKKKEEKKKESDRVTRRGNQSASWNKTSDRSEKCVTGLFSGRADHTLTATEGRGATCAPIGREAESYPAEPRCFLPIGPV